jgi:hypothetical protein
MKLKWIGLILITTLTVCNCSHKEKTPPGLCLNQSRDSLRIIFPSSYMVFTDFTLKKKNDLLILDIYTNYPFLSKQKISRFDTLVSLSKDIKAIKFGKREYLVDSLKICKRFRAK